MSENKHTPGPWEIKEVIDAYGERILVVVSTQDEPMGKPIVAAPYGAEIDIDNGDDYAVDPDFCESFGNMRLCAAAPELLEALKECCEEISIFDVPRCYACRVVDGHCAAKESCKVYKAIKKAEGGENAPTDIIRSVELFNEDELTLDSDEYDQVFESSIVDGVRLFPYVDDVQGNKIFLDLSGYLKQWRKNHGR